MAHHAGAHVSDLPLAPGERASWSLSQGICAAGSSGASPAHPDLDSAARAAPGCLLVPAALITGSARAQPLPWGCAPAPAPGPGGGAPAPRPHPPPPPRVRGARRLVTRLRRHVPGGEASGPEARARHCSRSPGKPRGRSALRRHPGSAASGGRCLGVFSAPRRRGRRLRACALPSSCRSTARRSRRREVRPARSSSLDYEAGDALISGPRSGRPAADDRAAGVLVVRAHMAPGAACGVRRNGRRRTSVADVGPASDAHRPPRPPLAVTRRPRPVPSSSHPAEAPGRGWSRPSAIQDRQDLPRDRGR